MRNDPPPIRAAGALLWRWSGRAQIQIAMVHRPRYDDWSLPKGKADAGESAPIAAVREVKEETGFDCILGRALTTVSYLAAGRPKVVEYFAARSLSGEFEPNKEVDRLEWLPLPQARARMTYAFDQAVLDTFAVEEPDLSAVLLVRHARAGQREAFQGDDALRPLDAKGRKQAAALVAELLPFGPATVHSAPVERCVGTVAPLAQALDCEVVMEPTLAEDAYRIDPAGARRRLVELANGPAPAAPAGSEPPLHRPAAACSQGGVIPGVVKSLAGRSGATVPKTGTGKGAFWLLTFDRSRLVQADPYPSPTV